MSVYDIILQAFSNLWRNLLRALLTCLGVTIGTGALVSMVSFGVGLQKNLVEDLVRKDLFSSLSVYSKNNNADDLMSLSKPDDSLKNTPLITDGVVGLLQKINNVEFAFPLIVFPVRVSFDDKSITTNAIGIPSSIGKYSPFSEITHGAMFVSDTAKQLIITKKLLDRMNIKLKSIEGISEDGSDKLSVSIDSVIGQPIELSTVVLNKPQLMNPIALINSDSIEPFVEVKRKFVIGGIVSKSVGFTKSISNGDIYLPIKTARKIPRIEADNIRDIVEKKNRKGVYPAAIIKVTDLKYLDAVRDEIHKLNFRTFSVLDNLSELKRAFLIINSLLGAIGVIALFVAALGITNTMVMSILERTREIGILKAIGFSELQIRLLFFVEAGLIGFVGGVFGIVLGWIVTRISNYVAETQIPEMAGGNFDLFYFPIWLIIGAVLFSVIISLIAGMYPANRAAKLNAVEALRYN